jgi:hypothetical protein
MIFSINHFQESSDVNRGPAAFSAQTCKEMMKDLFSKSGEIVKSVSHAVTDKIAELNYGTRLKYLEFLGHHQFQSNKLNYKYAELINNSLKKKIITDEEAESLVNRLKTKGFNQIYMENHKAYPYIIDSLASTAQIEEASLKLKTELRSNFKKELEGMEISKRELESLSLIQNEINTEEDLSRAISYLDFSKTFKESERPECLNDLEYLYSGNEQSSYLKTFDKNQKKILKYTLKKGKAQGQIYQKLLYSCQAKGSTLEKSATNKRFFQTVIGLELTISSGAYLFVHRDEEKTDDWYKKFMVEILLKLGIAGARSGITTMSATEWYKKALQDYSLGVVNDVGPALGYSAAFSPSKKELKEKLDQMMEDPEFKEKVKRLEEILKEDGLLDKYKTQVTTANGEQVTVDSIKSNEEAKDLLMDALAKDIYEDQQGEWIQTGDVGLDRYIFNRIWGVQSSVRNIVVNLMIYRTLCMGKINPKEAYLTAIGIYSANKLISEPLYQSLREKGINQ